MAKKQSNTFGAKWILIAIVILAVFVSFTYFKNNPSQPKEPDTNTSYRIYQDYEFGFTIEHPEAWTIEKDTQVFENGDAIAFRKTGLTQKEQTELTDGAQVVVSQPFTINTDLSKWVKQNFSRQAEFSKNTINGRTFEKVYDCSGVGCMTYYFTLNNDQTIGIAVFAEGADKMVYENAIVYVLNSLKFTQTTVFAISESEAIAKVKALPEVVDYFKRVPNAQVTANGSEDNNYLIQVFEVKDGHTATFNWFNVDKTTGVLEKQF